MHAGEFATLDVRIVAADDDYHVVADSSYGGTYRGRFVNPISPDALRRFHGALTTGTSRDIGAADDAPTVPASDLADRMGDDLFAALFAGELLDGLRETFTLSQRDDRMVRIRLRLDTVPELGSLPWELLRDEQRDRYLCLSSRTQVVRHLGLPQPVRDLTLRGPLRVLVVVASPDDLPPLAVEQEWTALVDELQAVGAGDTVELRRVAPATLDALARELLSGRWHVFHFVGHGQADPPSLAFCNADGRADMVTADVLAVTLADSVDLRLAMLNACHSARASERDAFGGVAQELLQRSIPAVVAMQFAITDTAAIAFAGRFYAAISHGLPVDRAVGDARKALYQRGAEWATPVVHLRGDGVVFELAPDAPARPADGGRAPTNRRVRGRRALLVAGLVTVIAAFAALGWWATRASPGDDEADDPSSVETSAAPITLPADLVYEPTAQVPRICGPGGRVTMSAGPAELVGDIITIAFSAESSGLQTDTTFDPIRVVDDQGRPFEEVDAGESTNGFSMGDDDTSVTEVSADVSVNHNVRAHPDLLGLVLVTRSGECSGDDDPVYLPVAAPTP